MSTEPVADRGQPATPTTAGDVVLAEGSPAKLDIAPELAVTGLSARLPRGARTT